MIPDTLAQTRRTSAQARAVMAAAALPLAIVWTPAGTSALLAAIGFCIVLGTAVVQLLLPRTAWVVLEESLASVAAVLIIGWGPARVTPLAVLWLAAVASGVLARGGRAHWFGRLVLLIALALPIVRKDTWSPSYDAFCLAAIALLLSCGRVTQELRRMLEQVRRDADHDGLTCALTWSAFRDRLDAVARSRTTGGTPASLFVLDLDNFSQVNKTAGHAAGNTMLRAVVDRVQSALGTAVVIGRLGGDEFAVIVESPDPESLAAGLLAELVAPASGPMLSASIGIAVISRDGNDADSLLRAADVALRVAKRSGGHQFSRYAGDSLGDDGRPAREALERLIAGEGLSIVVQPIVSVPERETHAYEALARFGAGTSPLHWFALADELGLREQLELACLGAALALLPVRPAGTSLTINLSGPLLRDERTTALLRAAGPLDGLILELTENSLLEDTHGMHAAMQSLVGDGVCFAVDDMGAGYSGLRQIATVRPAYLKLDRSIITDVDTDPGRGALITAMVGYARQTGGKLVAEGVETEAELDALLALGVELVQGFYLARPGRPWPVVSPANAQPELVSGLLIST